MDSFDSLIEQAWTLADKETSLNANLMEIANTRISKLEEFLESAGVRKYVTAITAYDSQSISGKTVTEYRGVSWERDDNSPEWNLCYLEYLYTTENKFVSKGGVVSNRVSKLLSDCSRDVRLKYSNGPLEDLLNRYIEETSKFIEENSNPELML